MVVVVVMLVLFVVLVVVLVVFVVLVLVMLFVLVVVVVMVVLLLLMVFVAFTTCGTAQLKTPPPVTPLHPAELQAWSHQLYVCPGVDAIVRDEPNVFSHASPEFCEPSHSPLQLFAVVSSERSA